MTILGVTVSWPFILTTQLSTARNGAGQFNLQKENLFAEKKSAYKLEIDLLRTRGYLVNLDTKGKGTIDFPGFLAKALTNL